MNKIKALVSKVVGAFKSGAAEKVFDQIAHIVPVAAPIVEKIGSLTPNRTVQEILSAFQEFGVPAVANIEATPAAKRGYILLDLATQVLAAKLPGTATNLLNSAAQFAVSALKANQ